MAILGVNAYAHDAGVALVDRSGPAFAVEEERFNRVQKTTAFPEGGLEHLRTRLGVSLEDVEQVGFPWSRARVVATTAKLVSYLSITEHFDDFSKGVIDTKHLVYYLSFITFGLFLTAKAVDSERWRG